MAGVAKFLTLGVEFAPAWLLEGQTQCDVRNLCKNRLLKCIAVQ